MMPSWWCIEISPERNANKSMQGLTKRSAIRPIRGIVPIHRLDHTLPSALHDLWAGASASEADPSALQKPQYPSREA
jgi:hypothetical protein